MAIPSLTGLETALRGLTAAQAAIDTTGANIANANNPSYSRQVVDLTESSSLSLPAFSNVTGQGVQLGTGVDVTTISRVRDQFLDIQYRAQNSNDERAVHHQRSAPAGPDRAGRAHERWRDQPAQRLLAVLERAGGRADERRGQAVAWSMSGATMADTFNAVESPAADAPGPGRLAVHHAHRGQRPGSAGRQPDRLAQHPDQPGAGLRPDAQRPARRSATRRSTTSPSTATSRSRIRATACSRSTSAATRRRRWSTATRPTRSPA